MSIPSFRTTDKIPLLTDAGAPGLFYGQNCKFSAVRAGWYLFINDNDFAVWTSISPFKASATGSLMNLTNIKATLLYSYGSKLIYMEADESIYFFYKAINKPNNYYLSVEYHGIHKPHIFGSTSMILDPTQYAAILAALDDIDVSVDSVDIDTANIDLDLDAVVLGTKINEALPLANANIFAANVVPGVAGESVRVVFCASIAGVLSVQIVNGANTVLCALNSGTALVAGALYAFDIAVGGAADTFNIQYSTTGGTINKATLLHLRGTVA